MEPQESIARAVATAGSAVVFAGLTVMIALGGLAVARIPFLTTMGVAAAVGVAIAVLIALTLLPALLGFAGEKLRPKVANAEGRRQARAQVAGRAMPPSTAQRARSSKRAESGLARRWVRLVTAVPVLTVVLVVTGLGALAYPAKDLRIALPSNGTADPGSPRAGDLRPGRGAFRAGLQRTADRLGHHRRLRRPARGDGRHRRRVAGAARAWPACRWPRRTPTPAPASSR